MTEEHGYHEIQLTGKQLVFLFMAATAVAVVIFLCGVVVGKGARPRLETVSAQTLTDALADGTSAAASGTVPVPDQQPPADVKSQLSYYDRLAAKGKAEATPPSSAAPATTPADSAEPPAPPLEDSAAADSSTTSDASTGSAKAGRGSQAASASASGAGGKQAVERPVPTPGHGATAAPQRPVAPVAGAPTGPGFSVQVAAIKGGNGAEALVKRLTAK